MGLLSKSQKVDYFYPIIPHTFFFYLNSILFLFIQCFIYMPIIIVSMKSLVFYNIENLLHTSARTKILNSSRRASNNWEGGNARGNAPFEFICACV